MQAEVGENVCAVETADVVVETTPDVAYSGSHS